jgi:8-oxo-dGTP pyrophosphatase MutT (NUDIX family)
MQKKDKLGAGVLVFKDFYDGKRILILLDQAGKFDIPKGHVDACDVNSFSTAQRECFEETQVLITLTDLLTEDFYQNENLTIYCAKTTQDPILTENPATGMFEHVGFYWFHPDVALIALPKYLSKALRWGLKYTV